MVDAAKRERDSLRHMLKSVITVLFLMASLAAAPATQPAGDSHVAWPLPSDVDFVRDYTALATRHGFKLPAGYAVKKRDESLPQVGVDPTYELRIPPANGSSKPPGLFVWISAGDDGKIPRDTWKKILDKHNLIWIGPNDVGNKKDTLWRTFMAIEAVRNARERLGEIDAERIYISGVSGGGRIASHAAIVAPDTFTGGGFYIVGCDFFRDTPVDPKDRRGKHYRGFWPKPDLKLIKLSKERRYVLLTGENDFNLGNTRSVYAGYKGTGYKNVTLLEVPGMGHTAPDGEWFEKGIELLDKRVKRLSS
jgi:hypothetical protein